MKKVIRFALCALLIAALALPALAQSAEETAAPPGANQTSAADLFGISETNPYVTPTPTETPEATPTAPAASADVSPVPNSAAGGDVFGGAAEAGVPTPTPMATIPGYNPFDSDMNTLVEVNADRYVIANVTNVFTSPNDKGKLMMTMGFGQQVRVNATQGGWARLEGDNDAVGYCLAADLGEEDPNTLSSVMYAQPASMSLYQLPDAHAAQLRDIARNDSLTMTAITGDGRWARVTDGTNVGYVPAIALDDQLYTPGTQAWCAVGSAAVMTNPANWIRLSTLSFGQSVYLVGYIQDETIAKIRTGSGYVAYCDASVLTVINPVGMNVPMYVQVEGDLLYQSSSLEAARDKIRRNTQVTLLGFDANQYWAMIRYKNEVCYIPYLFLGSEKRNKDYKVVVTTREAPLYREASTTSDTIATLPAGTRLYLGGGINGGAVVVTISDGITQQYQGYMPLEYLKSE